MNDKVLTYDGFVPRGTVVKNPTHRSSMHGYSKCTHCGKGYTHLGIARHWPKCKMNPKNGL